MFRCVCRLNTRNRFLALTNTLPVEGALLETLQSLLQPLSLSHPESLRNLLNRSECTGLSSASRHNANILIGIHFEDQRLSRQAFENAWRWQSGRQKFEFQSQQISMRPLSKASLRSCDQFDELPFDLRCQRAFSFCSL